MKKRVNTELLEKGLWMKSDYVSHAISTHTTDMHVPYSPSSPLSLDRQTSRDFWISQTFLKQS